ncbi:MAG TPA: ferritin-like domain-containing protein [Thermomicrobiales bacterium]|nr:ferritin-like domain-containing protein [Thermomicrobiales bacterium]
MTLLQQAGGGALALGIAPSQTTALRAAAATCESVQDIINIAATAEALAVTALGGALDSAAKGNLALNAEQVQFVTAARAEEQAHYAYLTGAGAKPLTTTFTLPDTKIVTDPATFLKTVIGLEEAFIAAYLAAAQEFAILGQPKLVQVALQVGAVEAEHRAHARFYAITAGVISDKVPNNLAFEKAMFTAVGGAAQALTQLGWIGGNGTKITYPGPGQIDNSGVTNLQP